MWRTAILVIIVCCTVHTAPPHHNLLENSDEDVRRLGLLVNELVELIEKVASKGASEENLDAANKIGFSEDPDLVEERRWSTRHPSLLQKISTYKPLLYQKLQNKFTTTIAPVTNPTPASVTPASVTPASVTPAPVTPAPVTPAPVTPAPVTPAPVTPAPVTPAPVTPAPVTPAPVTPAPGR